MKKSNLVIAGIMFALSVTQIANAQDMDNSKLYGDSMKMESKPKMMMMSKNMSNVEILSVLHSIDEDEITAANLAQTKQLTKQVSEYAKAMIDHHTTNMEKIKDLLAGMNASYAKTPMVIKVHKENNDGLARIVNLDGIAFDIAYIDLMARDHRMTLETIKKQLMPMTKDAALKKFLAETAITVASHLKMAEDVRKTL